MCIVEQLCRQVPNGQCGRSGQCWTDSWKWACLQSQSTQLAAWGWARGLQRSLNTLFSCICSDTVLATLDTHWLLAFPPNPSGKSGAAAPRPARHFPLCSLSRWLSGAGRNQALSLFRSFCLQWLAILHILTEPLLYPISPVQCLLFCHPVVFPLITFHLLLLSFLCFHRSRSLVKRSQPHKN